MVLIIIKSENCSYTGDLPKFVGFRNPRDDLIKWEPIVAYQLSSLVSFLIILPTVYVRLL